MSAAICPRVVVGAMKAFVGGVDGVIGGEDESECEGDGDKDSGSISRPNRVVGSSAILSSGFGELRDVVDFTAVGEAASGEDGEIVEARGSVCESVPSGRFRAQQDLVKPKSEVSLCGGISCVGSAATLENKRVEGLRRFPDEKLVSLFIGNLPFSILSKWLHQKFKKFRVVKDAFIPGKVSVSSKRRFGFVWNVCMDSAMASISAMDGFLVGNFHLQVQVARLRRMMIPLPSCSAALRDKGLCPLLVQGCSLSVKSVGVGHNSYAQAVEFPFIGLKQVRGTPVSDGWISDLDVLKKVSGEVVGDGLILSSAFVILSSDPSVEEVRKIIVCNGASFEVLCRQQAPTKKGVEDKLCGRSSVGGCNVIPVESNLNNRSMPSVCCIEDEGHLSARILGCLAWVSRQQL